MTDDHDTHTNDDYNNTRKAVTSLENPYLSGQIAALAVFLFRNLDSRDRAFQDFPSQLGEMVKFAQQLVKDNPGDRDFAEFLKSISTMAAFAGRPANEALIRAGHESIRAVLEELVRQFPREWAGCRFINQLQIKRIAKVGT